MPSPKPKPPAADPITLIIRLLLLLFISQLVLSAMALGYCLTVKSSDSAMCKDPFAVTAESLRSTAGAVLAMLALYLRPPDQSP